MTAPARLIVAVLLFTTAANAQQQAKVKASTEPLIIGSATSQDSRGETVYDAQGKDKKHLPPVPGKVIAPVLLHSVAPEFPNSLRGKWHKPKVIVEGVVTENGDFIDLKIQTTPLADDVRKSALDSLNTYKFQPATLDGKPVAVRLNVLIQYKFW